MKKIIWNGFLCAVSFVSLSATTWTASNSGNWNDTASWQNGTVPTVGVTGDFIYINNAAEILVNSALNYNSRLTVGSTLGSGILRIASGGEFTLNNRFYAGGNGSGANLGLLSIEGGTLYAKGTTSNYGFYVANSTANSGATGQLNISSGSLVFNGGNVQFNVGRNNNTANSWAVATISQTGGSVTGTAYLLVSDNTTLTSGYSLSSQISMMGGTFSISGNSSNANAFGSNAVSGAHVSLTVSSNMTTFYLGNNTNFSGDDTRLILDVAQLNDWEGKTIAQFGGTLTINGAAAVIADFSNFGLWDGAQVGDSVTITLLSYNSLSKTTSTADTITGLDTDMFEAGDITWGSNAATITLTYIPEPAMAAGALGLLVLAFAACRRR